ncbi:MAG: VCBS repeat-containing protein [Myxacorys californica WJT36-NPBG1]|nr:VCBS repeat-containing protein [Myxacorys californica WJT36-NPBG1]
MVTADYDSKAVSVLLGQGNGSFDQAVRFGVGNPPGSVAIGDFNGDGKSDLVTANDESDDVSVLLGQGNGRFDQAVHFGVGNSPNSVAIGDFNLDGKPDLVTTNGGSNDISLLVGQGNGSFGPAINFGGSSLPPFFPGLNSAAVGDFNLDGKPDLVTLYSMPNVVSVYLNTTQTNQPPIAQDDTVSAAQNTALHIPVATLLANDLGTDLLSITGLSSVINGVVGLSDSGTPSNTSDDSISFTPAPGFSGNASFNYSISDGMGGTSTATVTVVVGTVQNGGNGKDTLTGNEGNDVLDGGNGKDTLMGNGGNDTLRGRNGDDVLDGGLGHDTVIGGNGRDIFVLSAGAGIDTLVDFKEGTDLIGLSGGLSFSSLTFSGNTILNGTEVLAALTGVNTTTLTSSNFITV